MINTLLFTSAALIWGSTWLAIKFQLGATDPLVSIVFRFGLAAVLLLLYAALRRKNLRYGALDHLFLALQGFLLFGLNYCMVYLAEMHLTSGLVAVIFSTMLIWNIFCAALFLHQPIRPHMIAGAATGLAGIVLIFQREIFAFSLTSSSSLAVLMALLGTLSASLGNLVSALNQRRGLPVLQTNAFGMLYSALAMTVVSLLLGRSFRPELSFPYLGSLVYLSVFGSILAFGTYLRLVGSIGVDKAAYVMLLTPIIALLLSTIFEGYRWPVSAFIGLICILLGNLLIMKKTPFRRRAGTAGGIA
jgi:drug/metabolite transporter (DMT)-like permease